MANDEQVHAGDLIMWVGRDGVRYFGKVISFTWSGSPIARRIIQPEYDFPDVQVEPLRYAPGREVPNNWTMIATWDSRTVDQVHPITKARMDYETLEASRKYPF